MSETTSEVVAGGAVLAIAAGFLFYAVQASGFGSDGAGYALRASFRSIEGVTVGSDVRLAGVKVGTVTDISLSPESYRAETAFRVKETVDIPDDSAIVISSEGLLGGNFVEIMPGGSQFYFQPGDEIEQTQGAVSLITLLMKFVTGDSGAPQ